MITTKRANNNATFDSEGSRGGVGLLERQSLNSYVQNESIVDSNDELSDARERMKRNLDKLLNHNSTANSVVEDYATVQETTQADLVASQDEDIKPSSTTMQFSDGNIDQIYNDLEKTHQREQNRYYLNGKGKLVLVLYALAVTVILALIVLNTGVLATLKTSNAERVATVQDLAQTYAARVEYKDYISSNEYVIEKATNEFGMIIK